MSQINIQRSDHFSLAPLLDGRTVTIPHSLVVILVKHVGFEACLHHCGGVDGVDLCSSVRVCVFTFSQQLSQAELVLRLRCAAGDHAN